MNPTTEKTETVVPDSSPNLHSSSDYIPLARPVAASRRSKAVVIGVAALAVGVVLAAGIVPRLRAQDKLVQVSRETAGVPVVVTNVTRSIASPELILPASVRAFEETTLYSRANGYLNKWLVDIGGKVEAGQVLAEIDTPDLDQELNQSRAALAQAEANLVLSKSTASRWQSLLKSQAVSQQEADEKAGALAAREADANAAQAAVRRLEQLASYKQIRAPFSGIVTRRNVDTGALILAGASGTANSLFNLAQISTLRVFVDVPQAYMRDVSVNLPVEIRVSEFPHRIFTGKVVRTAGALESTTRTLLTEVQVDNQDGALMPGIHAEAKFRLAQSEPPIVVPATSVMIRGEGTLVAVVDGSQTIHLQQVQLGRDLGTSIEVVAGLADHTTIVLNPSDALKDGTLVLAQSTPATAPQLARKSSLPKLATNDR
jgi:RND family efflux transporter MFP subunit